METDGNDAETPGNSIRLAHAIAVKPSRRRFRLISHTMHCAGGNKQFFSDRRPDDGTADLKFHLALNDHHELVDGMAIILPHLSWRISPNIATKTAGTPGRPNGVDVDRLSHWRKNRRENTRGIYPAASLKKSFA